LEKSTVISTEVPTHRDEVEKSIKKQNLSRCGSRVSFSTEQDGNKKEYMPVAVQDEECLAEQIGYMVVGE
jgi:hypothetical protein